MLLPMISYTPNFEDVLLRRCFPNVRDGFYVDIGAHHPTHASVTRWFYDQGWSGINIEPGEGIVELRAERTRDINLELAVSDHIEHSTFFVHTGNIGTSTLMGSVSQAVADKAGEMKPVSVAVSTLPAILEKHAPGRHIHFLKIDAEGAENAIITSADWARHRPEVIVVESTEAYTNIRRQEPWQTTLKENRYCFGYFDGVNDFWVREESSVLLEAFKVPVNVLDNFRVFDPELEGLKCEVTALRAALDAKQRRPRSKASVFRKARAQHLQLPHKLKQLARDLAAYGYHILKKLKWLS